MDLATTLEENPAVKRFQEVAKELDVVIPVSFFERAGNAAFNSIAIIDADGTVLGKYRKTHIPDGMPYAEKFFFTPGDTGFKVWKTKYATIGVGIWKLPDVWRFWGRRSCFTRLRSAVSRFFRRIPNRTGRDVCRGMRLQISCL